MNSTQSQPSDQQPKFHGVSYDSRRGKFQAYTRDAEGKKRTFGNHATAEEAARAYDHGVRELALDRPLNFTDQPTLAEAAAPATEAVREMADLIAAVGGDTIEESTSQEIQPSTQEVLEPITPLSEVEQEVYSRLKAEIKTMVDGLGIALTEVRDRKLYRQEFRTFEEFVRVTFNKSRRWAYLVIDAASTTSTLEAIGVKPANEREARDLKQTAQQVAGLSPESQQTVAKFIEAATGTKKPSTSQVKSVVDFVARLDEAGTVSDPETGADVPFTSLPEEKRLAVIRANVTESTHERMQRQQAHIQDSISQKESLKTPAASGKRVEAPTWSDWCMNYGAQGLTATQRLVITVQQDDSGNPKAQAQIIDATTGEVIAEGGRANFLKAAVMSLVGELNAGEGLE